MLGKYINHCEDSFTASIFTHLLHFPSEVFWLIIRDACYSDHLPEIAGELIEDESFWPHWCANETDNKNFVEPDLFLRFREFDLIIEAKRWDDKQQYRSQWEKELQSYLNEYSEESKPVYLIALGGLNSTDTEFLPYGKDQQCLVVKARWNTLLDAVKKLQRDNSLGSMISSQTKANYRLCNHIIDLFAWHGFSTGKWFSDFPFSRHRLTSHKHHPSFSKTSHN